LAHGSLFYFERAVQEFNNTILYFPHINLIITLFGETVNLNPGFYDALCGHRQIYTNEIITYNWIYRGELTWKIHFRKF